MRSLLIAGVVLAATGCTMPNPETVITLDGPAALYAWGPRAGSHIDVRRQGPLDPDGHEQSVAITDARLTLDLSPTGVRVTRLDLSLADVDLPASQQVPEGLSLRAQKLSLDTPTTLTTATRESQAIAGRLDGALRYHVALPVPTGLYPLGESDVTGSLTVDVGKDEHGRLRVWLHADPAGTCGAIGDLMTLSRCQLDVELDGVDTLAK